MAGQIRACALSTSCLGSRMQTGLRCQCSHHQTLPQTTSMSSRTHGTSARSRTSSGLVCIPQSRSLSRCANACGCLRAGASCWRKQCSSCCILHSCPRKASLAHACIAATVHSTVLCAVVAAHPCAPHRLCPRAQELDLIWNNAVLYNGDQSAVGTAALRLKNTAQMEMQRLGLTGTAGAPCAARLLWRNILWCTAQTA